MSNRTKLRGHGGNASGGTAASQQAMLQILAGLQAMSDELQARCQLRVAARRAWCGQDPAPAELPCWPEDSAGDRFFSGMMLDEAMKAPSLTTTVMPDARVIAAEPAHWNVALSVLVRAVLLDGVPVDDALVDATVAVIGQDSLPDVLGVLTPLLGDVLPELEGQVVAEALVRAFSHHYRCEMPGDDEVLERLAGPGPGNPLEDLLAARVVTPEDALRVGLTALAALGELCRSGSASVLPVAA